MAIAIKKPTLIAYLLSLMVAGFSCLHDYNRQDPEFVGHVEEVALETFSLPSLDRDLPDRAIVGSAMLWDVQESGAARDLPINSATEYANGQFYLKSTAAKNTICKGEGTSECWVFYGVFSAQDGLSAILFNPVAEERWQLLHEGDQLAEGLRLTRLKPDGAILTWKDGSQVPHNIELDIFELNIHDVESEKTDEKEAGE